MSTPPPAALDLARQILAGERAGAESFADDADRVVRACETLRVTLTKLVGTVGFSSLLFRALTLAIRQAPSLEGLRVEADGSLAGFDDVRRNSAPVDAAWQGGVVLVAELLGLLIALIGDSLTLSLVREAWPGASLGTTTRLTEEKP